MLCIKVLRKYSIVCVGLNTFQATWTRCTSAWYRYWENEKEKREARKEQHMQIFDQLFLERPPVPIGCKPHSSLFSFLSSFSSLPMCSFTLSPSPFTLFYCVLSFLKFGEEPWKYFTALFPCTIKSCFFTKCLHILTFYFLSFTCGSYGPLFNEFVYHSFGVLFCSLLFSSRWKMNWGWPKKVCLETRIRISVVLLATPCAVNRQGDIWSVSSSPFPLPSFICSGESERKKLV